jgi:hypothetical protein
LQRRQIYMKGFGRGFKLFISFLFFAIHQACTEIDVLLSCSGLDRALSLNGEDLYLDSRAIRF